jgi:hypothetical protein
MSLLSKLLEKQAIKIATATPATFATEANSSGRSVASAATVNVANSPKYQIAATEQMGAADAVIPSRWWLIHYPDRDPLRVACAPAATYAEIRKQYPHALALEPFTPSIRQPSAQLSANEEAMIREWLVLIDETDTSAVDEVIDQCQRDSGARDYFISRAVAELPKPVLFPDDRRTCDQCSKLAGRRCRAAMHGEIAVSRDYEPILGLPHRCGGYAPREDDFEKRSGAERWPELIYKGAER